MSNYKKKFSCNNHKVFENANYLLYMCKLHKAIYVLKQAHQAWFDTLTKALINLQFKKSKSYQPLFYKFLGLCSIYLLVYIDDIIVIDDNEHKVQALITLLQS